MLILALLTVACALLFWPSQADAQIHAWRDANGHLVLSDRKLDANAVTYAVPGASSFRSTRPIAANSIRAKFEPLVQEHAQLQGLRPDLVRAVIQSGPWPSSNRLLVPLRASAPSTRRSRSSTGSQYPAIPASARPQAPTSSSTGNSVRLAVTLVAALTLGVSASQNDAPLPAPLLQMVEAERAFAARALVAGWKQSFLEYFSDAAIGFDGGAGPARDQIRKNPDPPPDFQLLWEPRAARWAI